MKFIDLKAEYRHYEEEINHAVLKTLDSGQYLLGAELKKLEKNLVLLTGKKYAIGCGSATDGLQLVLQYLWKPGITVILPGWGAYPTSVAAHNVVPKEWIYYVDVDRSMTINSDKLPEFIDGCIVLAVNLYGNDADVHQLANYCLNHNGILVMDCAQSTGSATTAWGAYSVYSFYPSKILSSMGDGGCIVGNDLKAEQYFRRARFYGQDGRKGVVQKKGINSRMDEIQCAIVNAKFDTFQKLTEKRIEIAQRYLEIVQGITWRPGAVYHLFPILFHNREKVIAEMEKRQIPYVIHYEQHVSEMPALRGLNGKVGYRVNDKILSIPCHAFMKEDEIQKVEEFLNDVKGYEVVE